MSIINKPLSSKDDDMPSDLSFSMQRILMMLLGANERVCTPETLHYIQTMVKQDRVFNAFFDFAERIYEYIEANQLSHDQTTPHDQHFRLDSPIIQILQKNRIAFSFPKIAEPSSFSESTISSQLDKSSQSVHTAFELVAPQNNDLHCTTDSQETNHEEGINHEDDTRHGCSLYQFMHGSDDLAVLPLPYILKFFHQPRLSVDQETLSTYAAVSMIDDVNQAEDASQPNPMQAPKVTKMPYFQIPNARVGLPYQEQIKIQNSPQQAVQIKPDSVSLDEAIGISYDSEQQAFVGTPTTSGEYPIKFNYFENDAWREGHCTFIITADPKSLWQVKEPGEGELYPKPHSVHQYIKTANHHIAAASRRGRSHEHAGSFRDDDFSINNIDQTNWSVLAVADGAGSAMYSREGSRIAVQTVSTILEEHIRQNIDKFDACLDSWQEQAIETTEKSAQQQIYTSFYEVFHRASMEAIDNIERIAKHHSVPAKTFATTLLVAAVKHYQNKVFVCTFWIGDGAIAVYSDKKMRLMGTPDGGEFAGQTRFLDKSITAQFDKRVNIGFFDDMQAVILMTDGISDPKFETDSGLLSQDKWNGLWSELSPILQQEKPDECLLEWMHFFSAGHHDDRTLAVLWPNANQGESFSND